MYLALIILPLLGSITSGFFGRKIGVKGSHIITCSCVGITTMIAIILLFEVGLNNIPVTIYIFRWIDSESLFINWSFNFDSLTVSMLVPVLIVSFVVHIYSISYMSHDPHNQRFFSYLSLFTFMMIILVTANNFLLMFVGWEGVGICSYLLVSFWFTRIAANQSSISAFLTNRVGDCLLTIGMFALIWSFGNIDFYTIFSLTPYFNKNIILIISICLLIGAMAKSSQIGLHVWLPMAMEGPTPVSALIHAATMVTAGVYLLMRVSPIIEYSSTILLLCLWIGAATTVFSSLIGLFQQDIKKVIAYSTMSQLGMMVIAVGLSSYNIALFHLINHAFYKGLLFLGAGAVIHAVADNQDFRKYGGLIAYLPLTYSTMLIASMSLVAIPFMTGFYSKDLILESAFGQFNLSSITVYTIAIIGAMFTTLYSMKILYLTFLSKPNGSLVNYKTGKSAHEGNIYLCLPLIILAIFSVFFGYIVKDIYIGLGSAFFSDNSIFIHPKHEIIIDTEFAVPILYKLLPLVFTVCLSIISILFLEFYPKLLIIFKLSNLGYKIFGFLNQRFAVEQFYNIYISNIILKLGGQTVKIMDKGSVEVFGPFGLEKKLQELSKSINNLSTGVVTSYALYILIGLIFFISIMFVSVYIDNYIELLLMFFVLVNINIFVMFPMQSIGILINISKKFMRPSLFSRAIIIPLGIRFFLSYPAYDMCSQLNIMTIYYVYCAFLGCICTITGLCIIASEKDICWKSMFRQFIISLALLLSTHFIIFPFILSIACSYDIYFLLKSNNNIFINNLGSGQPSISSNPSSNYVSAESNASNSAYVTATSNVNISNSISSYPTPPPNLSYTGNESSVNLPSGPTFSPISNPLPNLPPSPILSPVVISSLPSFLQLPPGSANIPLTEGALREFNRSVSSSPERLPKFLASEVSFKDIDAVSLPSSEASITKGTPRAGSAISGDTPAMNPSLIDRESFLIPGNQFMTRFGQDVTFQPSASFLAWHFKTWSLQGNTTFIEDRFDHREKLWFLAMLKKDFPQRFQDAMVRRSDGSIVRDLVGDPKIDFSKIENDSIIRKHLRSVK